jgi:hypothetical protein
MNEKEIVYHSQKLVTLQVDKSSIPKSLKQKRLIKKQAWLYTSLYRAGKITVYIQV